MLFSIGLSAAITPSIVPTSHLTAPPGLQTKKTSLNCGTMILAPIHALYCANTHVPRPQKALPQGKCSKLEGNMKGNLHTTSAKTTPSLLNLQHCSCTQLEPQPTQGEAGSTYKPQLLCTRHVDVGQAQQINSCLQCTQCQNPRYERLIRSTSGRAATQLLLQVVRWR